MVTGKNFRIKLGLNFSYFVILVLSIAAGIMVFGCGKDKIITRELIRDPQPVSLVSPAPDSFVTVDNPTFIWHKSADAVRYQLQVSRTTDFLIRSINVQIAETTYTTVSVLSNATHYWRVRAQNQDSLWGDWSDAEIRTMFKSNYVNYIRPLSQMNTPGVAQDVFLRNDTAYVADGQSDLTLVNVMNPSSPYIIRNIDSRVDDFAQGVYVSPVDSFPYAFVADMDGKIQLVDIADTTGLLDSVIGGDQNLEDLVGKFFNDTLWIITVHSGMGHRKIALYQIVYSPFPGQGYFNPGIELPSDGMGIAVDSQYAYIACGEAGLKIVDITDFYNITMISGLELTGTSLSVFVKDNYAYVAADRSGLFVIDITDRRNPILKTQVTTTKRSKDVHIVGNYAFVADADGGLMVADISVPDSAHFVSSYATPYAYGVYANSNYIYLCDRDLGLLIFENLSFK